MGILRRAGRGLTAVVEVVGRALDVVSGFGVRSRGVNARERRRRDDRIEELTREHESGRLDTREFEERKRRLR